jgi:UDP-glucose 4-epimerase
VSSTIQGGAEINCLVTGAAGFIGSHLSELLLEQGHKVIGIDNLSIGKRKNLRHIEDNSNFSFKQVDVCNLTDLEQVFDNIDWVFHLAALADIVPSIEKPDEYFQSNVMGTFNVAKLSLNYKIKKVIYAASSSCYGIPNTYPTPESSELNPEYPYALTKLMGEQILMHWNKVYKLPVISLRLFNVYGIRARTSGTYGAVFGVFLAQKIAGVPFTVVGDGTQTRDFTFVTDVTRAFIAAAESNITGEIFNVGSGNTYSVNTLVALLNGPIVYIPKRPAEPDCTFADTSKIDKYLDWHPEVLLETGVSLLLEHIDEWSDAPVWNAKTIEEATKSWFGFLGTN